MADKVKRRNYFIKPDIQGLLILKIFMLVFFCCILYAVILACFSTDSMTITYENNNLMLGKTPFILFKDMMKAQGVFIVSGGVGAVIFALMISHHFAGPLYKLERCMKLMLEGDHSFTIVFRHNDREQELADVINRYNRKVSSDISEMRTTIAALGEKLSLLDVSKPDSAQNGVAEAAHLVTQLQEKLHQYIIQL